MKPISTKAPSRPFCPLSGAGGAGPTRPREEGGVRKTIWELHNCQCSIIGTCLSLGELRKIAGRTGLALETGTSEYVIHGTFVSLCKEQNAVSRAVDKALCAKFRRTLRRFAKGGCAKSLTALWRESMAEGDAPGPYWAVLTHPMLADALFTEAFGHIHMLSHLAGATNRADVRRLLDLEQRLGREEERFARVRTAFKGRVRDLVRENRSLKEGLRTACLDIERQRQRSKEAGSAALKAENEGLRRSLSSLSAMARSLSVRNEVLAKREDALARRLDWMRAELTEKTAETAFLEEEMGRLFSGPEAGGCPGGCEKAGTDVCPGPGLCGMRILYVGGRENLAGHYRALVERRGGEFVRHDGGVEETRRALPRLMCGVDSVICPVDRISHDACQCVKAICKRRMTPVKFLRSSSLSSLDRSLVELAARLEN